MGGVAAVEKAGVILGLFSPVVTQLTVRQIGARTGLPRSTVHGLSTSLCTAGLLEKVTGGGYRLGPALIDLGGQVIERTGIVAAAEGVLDWMPHRPGLEAHLGQLVGGWVVYLDRAARPPLPPMRNRVGLRAPAHLSGCGKAALSQMPLDDALTAVAETCHRDGRPLPDADELTDELTAARRAGYVINTAFQQGRRSVAVAVCADGTPVGGISLAGPSDGFDHSSALMAVPRVQDAGAVVSARLSAGVTGPNYLRRR